MHLEILKQLEPESGDFKGRLRTENIAFAKKARRLMIKELGFVPKGDGADFNELGIRQILMSEYIGRLSKDSCRQRIMLRCDLIRSAILKWYPEQVHFIDELTRKRILNNYN